MMKEQQTTADQDQAQRAEDPVRRHIPVRLGPAPAGYQGAAPPIKEGLAAGEVASSHRTPGQSRSYLGDVETTGRRAVYVLARTATGEQETPVFPAGPGAEGEAVAVFTSRELAVLYLQVARTDAYRLEDLAPPQLGAWLENLRGHGVRFVLVDPNRHDQARGVEAQPRLDLQTVRDFSGENAFREVGALGTS